MREEELEERDEKGYSVFDALSHVHAPPGGSLATPHSFVCMDGRTYWVKAQAQHGLAVELIAGRLAARVAAGPPARVIRVTAEATPSDNSATHLEGVNVGTEDVTGAINGKDLAAMNVTSVDPKQVDAEARARVVAYQTWVGVGDTQCMINLQNGVIVSIDHGELFSAVDRPTDPALTVVDLPGLPHNHGAESQLVAAACGQIESVSDDELLDAVACIPTGAQWRSERPRRLKIAQWLAHRRGKVREVLKGWK